MSFSLLDPIAIVDTNMQAQWDNTNTSSITPSFTIKSEFVRDRETYKIIYYLTERGIGEIGRGEYKEWTDLVTIEVRVKDNVSDTRYNEMVQEVLRIIGELRLSPGGGYDYWTYVDIRDESQRGNNWYRSIIRTEMKAYGREVADRTIDGGGTLAGLGEIYDGGDP